MAREIERKFLLRGEQWRREVEHSFRIRQGYVCGDGKASVRIRIGGAQATINIKTATVGIERQEFEWPVPPEMAGEMLAIFSGNCIDKTRHIIVFQEKKWEIDEFHGANEGLVVAEIELDDPDERFVYPPWLGDEVSDDPRYYNTELARRPYATW